MEKRGLEQHASPRSLRVSSHDGVKCIGNWLVGIRRIFNANVGHLETTESILQGLLSLRHRHCIHKFLFVFSKVACEFDSNFSIERAIRR